MLHNSNLFGSCVIHISIQGVLKLKKKFQRLKVKEMPGSVASRTRCAYDAMNSNSAETMPRINYIPVGIFTNFMSNYEKVMTKIWGIKTLFCILPQ